MRIAFLVEVAIALSGSPYIAFLSSLVIHYTTFLLYASPIPKVFWKLAMFHAPVVVAVVVVVVVVARAAFAQLFAAQQELLLAARSSSFR